jgi:hypothetical protein
MAARAGAKHRKEEEDEKAKESRERKNETVKKMRLEFPVRPPLLSLNGLIFECWARVCARTEKKGCCHDWVLRAQTVQADRESAVAATLAC